MHIEKMENGPNFPQETLHYVLLPSPTAPTRLPGTTALCLVYFTVELAKVFACEPNNTSKSGRPITRVSLAPCRGVTPL